MASIRLVSVSRKDFDVSRIRFVKGISKPVAGGSVAPSPSITNLSFNSTTNVMTVSFINAAAGNVLNLFYDDNIGLSSPVTVPFTLTSTEITAGFYAYDLSALAAGTYYAKAQVAASELYPGAAQSFTIAAAGIAITGVSMTLDQPIVALKPVYPISIQPGAAVGDQVQLRIATGAGMTGTITFNQTITLDQPMITNMVIPFNITAQTAGALLYAQAGVTRGAAAQVLSNIVPTQMPAAAASLLTRTPVVSVGDFLASGTRTFDALSVTNTNASRRILTLVGVNGDNDVRPDTVTIEGTAATAVANFLGTTPETTNDYAVKLYDNADATTTAWDVTSQFKSGAGATLNAYRSFAAAIQVENTSGLGANARIEMFGVAGATLPAVSLPAGAIGIAIAYRADSVVPTWTNATQEIFQSLNTTSAISIAKFTNSTGSTISWTPQVAYVGNSSGMLAGFAILP